MPNKQGEQPEVIIPQFAKGGTISKDISRLTTAVPDAPEYIIPITKRDAYPTVEQSMKIITDELRKDKSPNSWYYAWQSNIAMAIYDTLPDAAFYFDDKLKHKLCNRAAVKFLEQLTAESNEQGVS